MSIAKHSPAEIIKQLLVANNLLVANGQPTPWQGFVGHEPDKPDDCVTVYDTSPELQGRVLATGQHVRRWGVQLRIRAAMAGYQTGWEKATELDEWLTLLHNAPVVFQDARYIVASVTNESGPMHIGRDEQERRPLFTANYLCVVHEV